MSARASSPKVDLKLNLSQPGASRQADSPNISSYMDISPESSCVSSEPESSSSEPRTMVLAGCPRCLMYVMLPGEDPKCPKCKSPVLLDIVNEEKKRRTRNHG